MKAKHLFLMMALAASSSAFADEVYPSTPVEQLPLNDTIVNWKDDGMVIMEDGKGFVAMYNNSEGIYFQVLVKDRRLQQQFLRQGLVVYVDPNGKKKKKYAVHFPTLAQQRGGRPGGERPERGSRPDRRGERPQFNPQDTAGMFGDIKPMDPRDRRGHEQSKEERERHLKMLITQLNTQPASFFKDDEESIMAQGTSKVMTSGNNVVFCALVPYDKLEKLGKKGEISLSITVKERETSDDDQRGGMFGPPPGMMGGGMMPPPGMGGGFRRGEMLKEIKSFAEWIVFSTKNTNFTPAK